MKFKERKSPSILKKIGIIAIVFAIAGLAYNYFITEQLKMKEGQAQEYTVNRQDLATTILTPSVIPTNITTDTYLTKGTYTANNNLIIEAGATLEVEEGTIINFSSGRTILIQGTMLLNGTESESITLNHFFDTNGGSFITIESTGTLEATYSIFNNQMSSTTIRNTNAINNKGILKLDNAEIIARTRITNDVTNTGNIEITDSILPGLLNINNYIDNIVIEDNIISGNFTVPLNISNNTTFQNINNNLNSNMTPKSIRLTGNPVTNVKLTKQNYNISSTLTIPENIIFEMEAGATLDFLTLDTNIIVNGTFKASGTDTLQTTINYFFLSESTNNSTFITVEPTGTLELIHSILNNKDSGLSKRLSKSITNNGMLKLNNTKIIGTDKVTNDVSNYGNIEIINSELPGALYINNHGSTIIIENNIIAGNLAVHLTTSNITTFERINNNFNPNMTPKSINLSGNLTSSVIFTKHNYIWPSTDMTIPENVLLQVEAGSSINFSMERAKITVHGDLELKGQENERVTITNSYPASSNSAFITVEESGTFVANHATLNNLGFQNSTSINQSIDNKGTLILDNTKIIADDRVTYSIRNYGNIKVTNSEIHRNLTIYDHGYIIIENNVIKGSLSVALNKADITTFQQISGNKSADDILIPISLSGNPTQHTKLIKKDQSYKIGGNITIPNDILFEVEAGAYINVESSYNIQIDITVNGILNLAGTLNEPVTITNRNDSNTGINWGSIRIEPTGTVIASNASIKWAGGSYSYPIENNGQLIMWNSTVSNGANSQAIRYNTTNPNQLLTNNAILGNVTSNIEIYAPYNFWGHDAGPRRLNHETGTYIGSGFSISNNIFVEPFHATFVKTNLDSIEYIKLNEMRHFGIPGISSSSGNYSKQFEDINFANHNIDLSFERIYNSRSKENSIFGKGWSSSFASKIIENPYDPNSYIIYLPNGSINIFDKENNNFIGVNTRNTFKFENNKYILTLVDQTIYTYNDAGVLESITDKFGNVTQIITSSNGNITSIVDYANRTYTLEYNNNLLTKITDPIGRFVTYTYNDNLLSSSTNVDGIITTYTYDSNNLLTSIKENNNEIQKIEYFNSGINVDKVYKLTNEHNNVIAYSYNSQNRATTETDSNNRITEKHYDREGYTYKIVNPDNTETNITYNMINGINKYGEELSRTNIHSHKTTYTRDNLGRITRVTNPDSSFKQYTYNSKNNITIEVDEIGNITEYVYDNDGVTLLHIVKPIDGFTLYNSSLNPILFEMTSYTYYNSSDVNGIKGLIETTTNDKGTTSFEYDSYGNINKKIDALNNETTYTTNKIGWVFSEQTNNRTTNYQYNNSGNITEKAINSKTIEQVQYNYQNKPIKKTDGNGNFELLEYNKAGNVIKHTDKQGNINTYQYDSYGNKITHIQPNNSIYTYEYDQLNRLTTIHFQENISSTPILLEEKSYTNGSTYTTTTKTYTNETEYKTNIERYNYLNNPTSIQNELDVKIINYLSNGLVSQEIDANASNIYYYYTKTNRLDKVYKQMSNSEYLVTSYIYDNYGRVIKEKTGNEKVSLNTLPQSYTVTNYLYDEIGNISSKTTSSGEAINYEYDEFNNITKETTKIDNNKNLVKDFEYNYLNLISKETNQDIITLYTYDNVGNLTQEVIDNRTTSYTYDNNSNLLNTKINNIIQEQFQYDNMGNVSKHIDGNNNQTIYIYDKQNNLIKETNAKGFFTEYEYDLANRLVKSIAPNETVTTYIYDKFDNIIQKSINNEITTKFEYDKQGNQTKLIDAEGYKTTHQYDRLNNLTKTTDARGGVTLYSYDAKLNIIQETNAKNQITLYTYDERGNLTKTSIKENTNSQETIIEQNEYDLLNNITKTIDGNLNETVYLYNNKNQLIKSINPLGYIQNFTYNKFGEVIKITDNLDKEIIKVYDSKDNIIKETTQRINETEKIETSNVYDKNSNLIETTDGNENITSYQYDSLNNLTKMINPKGQATTYEYDNHNNQTKETNYLGDYKTFIYDEYDRLIETKNELNQTVEKKEYDKNHRQTKSIDANDNYVTYIYDESNNIIETIDELGNSEINEYDLLNNLIQKTDKNGNITNYQYDEFQNLIKVINALNEKTNYEYDLNNNLTKVIDGRGKITKYTFDSLNNELTEKDGLGNTESKTYYINGLLETRTTRNNDLIEYTYDVHDRLITENDITYIYDNNSNLINLTDTNNQTTRTYDELDRVISKTENGLTSIFEYDINGYKERTVDPLGNVTLKTYDKAGRLKSVNDEVEYEYNIDGTLKKLTYSTGATEEYFYNVDKKLSKLINTYGDKIEAFTYTYDNNGNIIKEVNPTQTTINTYDELNRLKTVKLNDDETTYTYDASGNRIKEESTKAVVIESENLIEKSEYKHDFIINNHDKYTSSRTVQITVQIPPGAQKMNTWDISTGVGGTWNIPPGTTERTYTHTINSTNQGMKTLGIQFTANGTNLGSPLISHITYDPSYTGTDEKIEQMVFVNNNDKYTNSSTVEVEVKSIPAGATRLRTSEVSSGTVFNTLDIPAGATEMTYKVTMSPNTEGEKTLVVYFEVNGSWGLSKYTPHKAAKIIYDSSYVEPSLVLAPAPTEKITDFTLDFEINNNEKYTNSRDVQIKVDVPPGAIRVDATGIFYNSSTSIDIPPGTTEFVFNYTLSGTNDGIRIIGLRFRNASMSFVGNQMSSYIIYNPSYTETGEKLEPILSINDGDKYTNSTTVEVKIKSIPPDATAVRTSRANDSIVDERSIPIGETELAYNVTFSHLEGDAIIRAWFQVNGVWQDSNTSAHKSTIIYDRVFVPEIITKTITKDYIYNSKNQLNQITEKTDNVVSKIITYEYDLNGNLLEILENGIIVESNVFNEKNELIETTRDNSTTEYSYNAEGKRISKSNGTDITQFVYEGKNIILEVNENGNELARNVYGLALVSRETNNLLGYYLYNGHGDVVIIVDASNTVLNTYEYDTFGVITNETETMDNPFKYAGYYYDSETNNYYLLSRYYNPEIARFISEDTYRGQLNDPLSLNRYVYVNNNPMIYIDPDGYFFKEIWNWFKGLFNKGSSKEKTDELIDFSTTVFDAVNDTNLNDAYNGVMTLHNLNKLAKEYEKVKYDLYIHTENVIGMGNNPDYQIKPTLNKKLMEDEDEYKIQARKAYSTLILEQNFANGVPAQDAGTVNITLEDWHKMSNEEQTEIYRNISTWDRTMYKQVIITYGPSAYDQAVKIVRR